MSEALRSPLEMFYHWETSTPQQVFLRQPTNLQWREYTWAEVADRVRRLANFIRAQGFPAGSNIGILSGNSADWIMVDFAIMLSGHVSVPLYPSQDVESARYVLDHSETRMLFLGAFDMAAKAEEMLADSIPRVGVRGCCVRNDYELETILAEYEPMTESPVPDLDSIFTILYTSGTTGRPKGVMHSHGTPAKLGPEIINTVLQYGKERERLISYLPLSHAAERILIEMTAIYCNATISFSEGLETFAEELRSIRPTFFFSVPRLWIKFKAAIDAKIPAQVQANFGEPEKTMVREQLGLDQAHFILTGSAPCPADVQQWFINMGMELRDSYGMTETFAAGSMVQFDQAPIPGCVGKPSDGTQIRLSDAGEICIKTEKMMTGYYKNPEKTAEVLIDGWYHTGDSGRFDEQGNLWVTGRISEVFKTTKGKFIKPSSIENLFDTVEELEQFCVFGHGKDQPLLLCNLSEHGQQQDRETLTALLEAKLAAINAELPPYKRVAQIFVTATEWNPGMGLLTPTMKLKRMVIEEHYSPWVSANSNGNKVIWQQMESNF